jgi:hypothetical protein
MAQEVPGTTSITKVDSGRTKAPWRGYCRAIASRISLLIPASNALDRLVMRRSWVQSLFSDASRMGVWIGGASSVPYVANARITASAASGPMGGLRMGRATPAAR